MAVRAGGNSLSTTAGKSFHGWVHHFQIVFSAWASLDGCPAHLSTLQLYVRCLRRSASPLNGVATSLRECTNTCGRSSKSRQEGIGREYMHFAAVTHAATLALAHAHARDMFSVLFPNIKAYVVQLLPAVLLEPVPEIPCYVEAPPWKLHLCHPGTCPSRGLARSAGPERL